MNIFPVSYDVINELLNEIKDALLLYDILLINSFKFVKDAQLCVYKYS